MNTKRNILKSGIFFLAVLGLPLGATAQAKPLKVFLLAGQSNMEGHVKNETFDSIGDDPKAARGRPSCAVIHEKVELARDLDGPAGPPPQLMGQRFLTLNTIVRVRQIEVTRDTAHGPDESSIHTPAEARTFREAIEAAWPGARNHMGLQLARSARCTSAIPRAARTHCFLSEKIQR